MGLADDATAAYANPAGLRNLTRPDVSVEGRYWKYSSQFTRRGHAPADGVTGVGVDTIRGLEVGSIDDSTPGFSFLSYVYPRERWAIAFYRHELANFEARIENEGAFLRGAANRVTPSRSEMDLRITNYGLSGSVNLGPSFSLGGGFAYSDFSLSSRSERFYRPTARRPLDHPDNIAIGGFFGPADFSASNLFNTQTQEGDDHDLAWQVGFLWKLQETWSLGGVYRRGPEFSYEAEFVFGPKAEVVGTARDGEILTRNAFGTPIGGKGTFRVPDVYGLGVAALLHYRLQITLDVQRVLYSQLADELVNLLQVVAPEDMRSFKIDDATEIHLGIEYTLFQAHPVALRLGAWSDPDHKMRFDSQDPQRILLTSRFQRGQDEIHYSAGIGLYVGAEQKYKLDAAVDLSDLTDTMSVSLATKF